MNPVRQIRAVLGSRRGRAWTHALVGAAVLVALFAYAGGEPFLRGLRSVTPGAVAAAFALAAIATWAAAWRWRIIAAGIGIPISQPGAVAAYYRSQFLNTVLPGGVVGDVHRAIAHGARAERLGDASRAVAAERTAGQAVQLVLAAAVLVSLGVSAYARAVGVVLLAIVAACAVLAVAAAVNPRARRVILAELGRLRTAFTPRGSILLIVVSSTVVVACHVATFAVAALAVGIEASPGRLIAVAMIAVLGASIPFNLGGWGPREGAAAWAFTAVGLGSASGIAASTAYGVLVTIALLPGAVVLAASARRRPAAVTTPRRERDAVPLAAREEKTP
ncbi:lysylphosphatidylglycerol synthase transmembrane domain-containing protein [Microbacterium sp. NPDC019599]|uniref:lysylphosphatidylglycerol synthase transmembrane domain-containing protein n=1 Tax=Microbacterium sp. NPDC019599 TaxID=3154690 RepID=UPI0034025BE8